MRCDVIVVGTWWPRVTQFQAWDAREHHCWPWSYRRDLELQMLLGMFLHRFGFSRKLVAAPCDRMDRVDPGEGSWSCFLLLHVQGVVLMRHLEIVWNIMRIWDEPKFLLTELHCMRRYSCVRGCVEPACVLSYVFKQGNSLQWCLEGRIAVSYLQFLLNHGFDLLSSSMIKN